MKVTELFVILKGSRIYYKLVRGTYIKILKKLSDFGIDQVIDISPYFKKLLKGSQTMEEAYKNVNWELTIKDFLKTMEKNGHIKFENVNFPREENIDGIYACITISGLNYVMDYKLRDRTYRLLITTFILSIISILISTATAFYTNYTTTILNNQADAVKPIPIEKAYKKQPKYNQPLITPTIPKNTKAHN